MKSDVFELIWFKLGRKIDLLLYSTFWFKTVDLDSRSQECEKTKSSAPIISQSFQLVWMEFGLLLRLVGVMNLILIYFVHSVFKGENLTYLIVLEKNPNTLALACIKDIYILISFLVWW